MSNDTNTWKPLGWLWVLFYKTFYTCKIPFYNCKKQANVEWPSLYRSIFSGCCSIKHFTLVTVTVEL